MDDQIRHEEEVAWTQSAPVWNDFPTPAAMLARALTERAAPETIDCLVRFQERWEESRAKRAFAAALAATKSAIPVIRKNRHVDREASGAIGTRTHYWHEDFAEIARTVDPILAEHGFSYRFATRQRGKLVSVTCTLSHQDGHSEANTLSAAHDDTGGKNGIQALGSAVTYLQRYTLKAALGLAASADDDGDAAEEAALAPDRISATQIAELQQLITASQANVAMVCGHLGVAALADIEDRDYRRIVNALERRRAALQAMGVGAKG